MSGVHSPYQGPPRILDYPGFSPFWCCLQLGMTTQMVHHLDQQKKGAGSGSTSTRTCSSPRVAPDDPPPRATDAAPAPDYLELVAVTSQPDPPSQPPSQPPPPAYSQLGPQQLDKHSIV